MIGALLIGFTGGVTAIIIMRELRRWKNFRKRQAR